MEFEYLSYEYPGTRFITGSIVMDLAGNMNQKSLNRCITYISFISFICHI